jgi:hypothetical protein
MFIEITNKEFREKEKQMSRKENVSSRVEFSLNNLAIAFETVKKYKILYHKSLHLKQLKI